MGRTVRRFGASVALMVGGAFALANCGSSDKAVVGGGEGGEGGLDEGAAGSSLGGSASSAGGSAASGDAGHGGDGEAGATSDPGGGGAGEASGGGGGSGGGKPSRPIAKSGKLDLLFVVDNSISMMDKQALLAKSVPALVERLVEPWCVGPSGATPPLAGGDCPNGTTREHAPVRDLHVGVLSSSLGSHGGDLCSEPSKNDHARLIGKVRTGLSSWNDSGYLKWDPEGEATPPGTSDSNVLAEELEAMVLAAGGSGCGYEAPLEVLYRFLVDPEPPLDVVVSNNRATLEGVDKDVLDQRAAFLRPDSAVMAVIISDENDCSIIDGGQAFLVTKDSAGAAPFRMPRATAACAEDPNGPCCRSCATNESSPPSGCVALASDTECKKGTYTASDEDHLNLRCFDQKRRFGVDFLYPIERYVRGFSATMVPNRAGELVPNPLFAEGRDPSLMTLTVIAGVPWQDLVLDHTSPERLEFLSTEELGKQGRWEVIVGDSDKFVPPTDPFMIESIAPRTGKNPITGQSPVSTTSLDPTAAVNGHEFNVIGFDDLQYACIFPLETPVSCEQGDNGCDCSPDVVAYNRPLCQEPNGSAAGTTQYYGKAYPGIRQLELARRLDEQSVVASICPRVVNDTTSDDFGYYPALRALQRRLAPRLK